MAPHPAPPRLPPIPTFAGRWRYRPHGVVSRLPLRAVAHHCPVKARPLTEPTDSVEPGESPHVRAFLGLMDRCVR
jgi:hypothetical protein